MTINEIINTGKKGTLDVLQDKKIDKVEKPVRDALIADDSAAVKVSTWGNLIDEIVDNSTYQLTSVGCSRVFWC